MNKYCLIVAATEKNQASTLKCLSIGTSKIINFFHLSQMENSWFLRVPIFMHIIMRLYCLNFGTPENNEFSIWNKWKIYYF